jgi:hypothetical protein
LPRIPLWPVAVAPVTTSSARLRLAARSACLLGLALACPASAEPIFASEVVSAVSTTAFTGGNVLGAPDRSGLFLASATDPDPLRVPGTLVLRFALGIVGGEGADLIVFDMDRSESDADEEGSVAVSADGNDWTPLGSIIGGTLQGRIDLPSALAEPVFFVRIDQVSGFSLDIDAVQANYPVPEPGSAALLAAGLALLARSRRRGRASRLRAPRRR